MSKDAIEPGDALLATYLNPETKNLLIECLETAGFGVTNTEHGLISFHLTQEKLSTTEKNNKLNTSPSIFPSSDRLHKVFEFIELNYRHNIRLKEVAQALVNYELVIY